MALDAVVNFGKTTVSIGYAAGAVSIDLQAGDGAKLPQPTTDGEFNLVWWNSTDYTDPSDDPSVEIVRCTARSTDTLTVTRAQEGTADVDHNTGGKNYKMCLAITKKMITDIDKGFQVGTRTRLSALAQIIPTATTVRLMFDSEQYDLGGNMDSTTKTGSATSTSANHLVDSAATFVAADVGRKVWNTTDNTYAEITVLNSSTDVTLNADIMTNGETYRIYDSQFTAPVTGVYLIIAGARLDSMANAQNTILKININGAYVAFGNIIAGAAGAGYVLVSTTYQITAAQKISIDIYHDNGGNQNVENSLLTFLSMQLMAK